MPSQLNLKSEQVRRAICRRTRNSRTKNEFVSSLFHSFRDLEIDASALSLEEMKRAVVVAGVALRETTGESLLNLPA